MFLGLIGSSCHLSHQVCRSHSEYQWPSEPLCLSQADVQLKRNNEDAEYISLHLPSHLGHNWCNRNAAEDLAKAELHLREGQLNDLLHHIQIALGHKSHLFRHNVCPARTQRLKTCTWAEVHAVESTVQHNSRVYVCAWKAMVDLRASTDLLDWYKVLRPQDLNVKTSIIAPHVRGQQNKPLPWFWTMHVQQDSDVGEWMEDCTCFSVQLYLIYVSFNSIYRVHWLQAKAQKL